MRKPSKFFQRAIKASRERERSETTGKRGWFLRLLTLPARFNVNRVANRPTSGLRAALNVAIAVFLLGFPTPQGDCQGPVQDPFPLHRVVIPVERVPVELERARQGILVQLPLDDFETLVKKASQGVQARKLIPNLVRAKYGTELSGQNLVGGTGTWTIHHPGSTPAVLPLSPVNLAMHRVRHEDGSDAIVSDFPLPKGHSGKIEAGKPDTNGKTPGLIVNRGGTQKFLFDWSLRGTMRLGALHFDLAFPSCPLTSLELKIPADQIVSLASSTALLTGPLAVENSQMRLWRLNLMGKNQIHLEIRPLAGSPDLPTSLFAQLASKQEITPDMIKADFNFQVEVLHHPVKDLVFDCSANLEPFEVSLRNAEIQSWHLAKSPINKGQKEVSPSVLTIHLREPFQGTLADLRIRCLAPQLPNGTWSSPILRLRQAMSKPESLQLQFHPDVQLEKWDPGTFRLQSTTTPEDGTQILNLVDLRVGNINQGRPSGIIKTQGIALHCLQNIWWYLGPQGSKLNSEITFDLGRGKLFQLITKLPSLPSTPTQANRIWEIEKVELEPSEAMQSWSTVGSLLIVDLRRGFTSRATAKLTVQLHTSLDFLTSHDKKILDFPDLEPVPRSLREGNFQIFVDPVFQGKILKSTFPPSQESQEILSGPDRLGKKIPTFSFPYCGHGISGKLQLWPMPGRFQATTQTQIVLSRENASIHTRLNLDPGLGKVDFCDFLVKSQAGQRWQLRPEDSSIKTARLEKLPFREHLPYFLSLGNPAPWLGMALMDPWLPLETWRLRFLPSLSRHESLVIETIWQPANSSNWNFPIPTLVNVPYREGQVQLHPLEVEPGDVRIQGLEMEGSVRSAAPAKEGITRLASNFHWSFQSGCLPRLSSKVVPKPQSPSNQENVDRAQWITYVREDGGMFHHFSFQVAGWQQREIPLILKDPEARILGAKVNDLWLENLPTQKVAEGKEIRFPAIRGGHRLKIEVFYATEASWSVWPAFAHLEIHWPVLPLPALVREHRWCLAPGLSPLGEGTWIARDISGNQDFDPANLFRHTWHLGESSLRTWLPWSNREHLQKQIMEDAEFSLRKKWSRDFSLGEALEHLIFDHLKDRAILLVDSSALAEVDINPRTPVGQLTVNATKPFWENVGLVYLPCPGGPLLTTRRKLESWKERFAFTTNDLEPAIVQALLTGRDQQGLVQTAAYWLRNTSQNPILLENKNARNAEEKNCRPSGIPEPLAGHWPGTDGHWTVWEAQGKQRELPGMTIVRTADLGLISFLGGIFTLVLAWKISRSLQGVWGFRTFLFWSTFWGMVAIWLPSPMQILTLGPLLAGLVLGIFAYLALLVRGPKKPLSPGGSTLTMKSPPSGVTSAVGLFILSGLGISAYAFPPATSPSQSLAGRDAQDGGSANPETVLILPGVTGPLEKALVTPKLLQRLQNMALPSLDTLEKIPLLIRAHYQGQVKESLVSFQAGFDVFSTAENGKIYLPLTGVELEDGALLDGVPVFPQALADSSEGYVIPVQGKGFHRLQLNFAVRWSSAADIQELRFGIPALLQNQLQLIFPNGWQDIQVPHGKGDMQIVSGKTQKELHVQLGRENLFQVRWRSDISSGTSANLEVQEAYLWDLRPGIFSLSALLNYSITKGSVNHFRLVVPEDLEVCSVAITGGESSPSATRIQKWRVQTPSNPGEKTGSGRLIHIDLAGSITGKVQLALELLPRLAFDGSPLLFRLPFPLQAKQHEGIIGYRLEGWDTADKTQNLAITRIAPELFAKVWQGRGHQVPGLPSRAFSFRRTSNNSTLQVILQPILPLGRQEVLGQVFPAFTYISWNFQAYTGENDISILEFEVPGPLTLADVVGADVQGPNLHHWSRADNRLQVWLERPAKEKLSIKLTGWVMHQPAGGVTPVKKKDLGGTLKTPPESSSPMQRPQQLFLASVRPLNVRLQTSLVKLQAGPGLQIEPITLHGLVPERTPLHYQAPGDSFDGTFQISFGDFPPEVRTLTTAGMQGNTFSFTSQVDCLTLGGNTKKLVLHLHHWPSSNVQIDLHLPGTKIEHQHLGSDHLWKLALPANSPRPLRLVLRGRKRLAPMEKAIVPQVELEHVQDRGQWVLLEGNDLQPVHSKNLAEVKDWGKEANLYFPELQRAYVSNLSSKEKVPLDDRNQREGTAWKVKDSAWQLQVQSQSNLASLPVHFLWGQHEIVQWNGYWLHQANYLIISRKFADIQMEMPEGAKLQAGSWGENFLPAPPQISHAVDWSLPPAPQGQILRLRWFFPGKEETSDKPRLDLPEFPGIGSCPTHTTLWLPPGFRIPQNFHGAAEVLLDQARGQMILASFLAGKETFPSSISREKDKNFEESKTSGVSILTAQKFFQMCLRHAEYELLLAGKIHPEQEQYQTAARLRLKELRRENQYRAMQGKYEQHCQEAEKQPWLFPSFPQTQVLLFPNQGIPLAGLEIEDKFITLKPDTLQDLGHSLVSTQLILVGFLALLILSFLNRLVSLLPLFWPEQVLFTALFGSILFGFSFLAFLLLVLAGAGRLSWFLMFLGRLWKNLFPPKKSSSSVVQLPKVNS